LGGEPIASGNLKDDKEEVKITLTRISQENKLLGLKFDERGSG
jgi:hypothetical protein